MPNVNGKYVSPSWINDAPPAIDADELNAISNVAEGIVGIELTVPMPITGASVTATNGSKTVTLTESEGVFTGILPSYGTWSVVGTTSGGTLSKTLVVDVAKPYQVNLIPELDDTSWSTISVISQSGFAESVWSVGDRKSVLINGTVGTKEFNTTLYVYIVGINHQGTNGITFQGFKTAKTNGSDICLTDSHYGSDSHNGSKWFNMNHWGDSTVPYNTNYGGWKGCDLRYDVLGSTDTPPKDYGSKPTFSREGYDATSTTATSPVSGTLMAALPADLRSVMKPMTVYTDNVAGGDFIPDFVTSSVDYLPLLSEFEIFGTSYLSNNAEEDHQAQYQYYANGNSVAKYRDSAVSTAALWWERSPYAMDTTVRPKGGFCTVSASSPWYGWETSSFSYGLAPVFLV